MTQTQGVYEQHIEALNRNTAALEAVVATMKGMDASSSTSSPTTQSPSQGDNTIAPPPPPDTSGTENQTTAPPPPPDTPGNQTVTQPETPQLQVMDNPTKTKVRDAVNVFLKKPTPDIANRLMDKIEQLTALVGVPLMKDIDAKHPTFWKDAALFLAQMEYAMTVGGITAVEALVPAVTGGQVNTETPQTPPPAPPSV